MMIDFKYLACGADQVFTPGRVFESKSPHGIPEIEPMFSAPIIYSNEASGLKVAGYFISLPAGLYRFCNKAAPDAGQNGGLPGVCISPATYGAGKVEIYGTRPDGWLYATGETAFVRVAKGQAPILLTTYQSPNGPERTPELEISRRAGMTETVVAWEDHSVTASILGNIQTRGDIAAIKGELLGDQGSQDWIEGFAIAAPPGISPEDFSYQAILSRDWLSPWFKAGHFCGSRGMSVPLLGLRIRLHGKATKMYNLAYWASFIDGTASSLVGDGEFCATDSLAPLEAMQITLTPKLPRKRARSK